MADLRRLALTAPHARSRERFLALHDIAQGTCATHVAARTCRHPQTVAKPKVCAVMGWLHGYSEHGPEALLYRRTGGRPLFARTSQQPSAQRSAQPSKKRPAHPSPGPLLDSAQRGRHQLVCWDEAHIHQDVDLGHGWGERGKRFFVASSLPGLSARVSLYGLYFYNEGWVRLRPYARANGEHTVDVLRRLRAEIPDVSENQVVLRGLIVVWDGAPYHPAKAVWAEAASLGIELAPLFGYSPDPMPVEALWRWLREDVTYHHCHATADDLARRVAAFEAQVNQVPCAVADRLRVKDHLDPEEEKLRFSS